MEPFFGELGVLAESEDGELVQCHICGCWYRSVGHHAYHSHSLSAAQYREKFGFNRGKSLASKIYIALAREKSGAYLRKNFSGKFSELLKKGYNTHPGLRLEGRRNMSQAHIGLRHSAESKKKVSDAKKGLSPSAETRKKLSEAQKKSWATRKRAVASAKATAPTSKHKETLR